MIIELSVKAIGGNMSEKKDWPDKVFGLYKTSDGLYTGIAFSLNKERRAREYERTPHDTKPLTLDKLYDLMIRSTESDANVQTE